MSSVVKAGICRPGGSAGRQRLSPMDHDELHVHVAAAALATQPERLRGLSARLVAYCWPGGQDDRYNPAAVPWVREWGPLRTGASVPVCSCASGHCDICN